MRVSFDLRSWALYVPFVSPSVHPLCLVSRRWGWIGMLGKVIDIRWGKWNESKRTAGDPFGLIMKVNKDWELIGILWRKTTGVLDPLTLGRMGWLVLFEYNWWPLTSTLLKKLDFSNLKELWKLKVIDYIKMINISCWFRHQTLGSGRVGQRG